MYGERRRKQEGEKGERNIDGKANSTQKVFHKLKWSQLLLCLQASALPENKERKQKLFPCFNVDISNFCTQPVLTLLPDDASPVWPFRVQGLAALIYASAFFCCITWGDAFRTGSFGAAKETLVCQVSREFKTGQLAAGRAQLETVTSIFGWAARPSGGALIKLTTVQGW